MAFSKRKVAIFAASMIAIIMIPLLAIKAIPLLDQITDKHRKIDPLSTSTAPLAENALESAPEVFSKIDMSRPYSPNPAEISLIPAAEGIAAFSLNPVTLSEPKLTAEAEQALEEALGYFTNGGRTCSCLIVDLGTGQGVGFNYHQRVYGASAFKGIVAAYVCEELIDNGAYELGGSLQSLMESSVAWSDNDAYRTLKTNYAGSLSSWVSNMGVDPAYVARYRFPTYSAQESTALWAHINEYLGSGTETAAWLGELLTRTNVSHIRTAVERGIKEGLLEADGEAVVQNKAGWISGSYNSTTDAGLVRMNGRVYAISVMSNAPDCDASRNAAADVALALLVAMQ